jgi:DNA-binding MarR family transcriptional regulator
MKQFPNETDSLPGVAHRVVEVAWRVLQITTKTVLCQRPAPELTPTQMRALGFLLGSPGASLSELAQHLGLQKPTASKVLEELVQRGRVSRDAVPGNRRKLALHITPSGQAALEAATAPANTRVAELLARLSAEERETVARAMSLLHPLVQPGGVAGRTTTHAA